jgi:ankyrin repeat protein
VTEKQDPFRLLAAGDIDSVRRIVRQDPSAAALRDAAGVSLLMHALYRGQRDLAMEISRQRDLDIFEAAGLGDLESLRRLCGDRSAVSAHSGDGFSALHFACYFGQPAAVGLLIEAGAAVNDLATNPMKLMPLHSAASARNLEAARLLLKNGALVNARQHGGWVPIHAAAQNGDRPMVELLLQSGADSSIANDQGKTPVDAAKDKGHVDLVSILEKGRPTAVARPQ